MRFSDFSPIAFASSWYMPEPIEKAIASDNKTPTDVGSREFADWLTERLRSAMAKGIQLARNDFDERFSVIIDDAIQSACRDLPENYEIVIRLALGSSDVTLIDPDGNSIEYPSNHESLGEKISDALEHANRHEEDSSEP